ncbi:unnamed protein product [Toxocara canis]|uniref:UBIQUITIN_CONJUGAT_2 domain-containing protein n=1 Tax=Toxocara canis TaxID=6265 RepID=A0A183VEP9_TOXCA|nr:unnamed protein product [Toxocara canis]
MQSSPSGLSVPSTSCSSQSTRELTRTRPLLKRDRSPIDRPVAPNGSDLPSASRSGQPSRETAAATRTLPRRDRSPLERVHAVSRCWQTATGWDPRTLGNSGNVPIRYTAISRRLLRELEDLEHSAPVGCWAKPKGDDLLEWVAVIEGPEDTVYRGGTFFLELHIPKDYPFHPPTVVFLTQIYHCNISRGVVCVDILRHGWTPSMTISTVLQAIVSLLYVCNPGMVSLSPLSLISFAFYCFACFVNLL